MARVVDEMDGRAVIVRPDHDAGRCEVAVEVALAGGDLAKSRFKVFVFLVIENIAFFRCEQFSKSRVGLPVALDLHVDSLDSHGLARRYLECDVPTIFSECQGLVDAGRVVTKCLQSPTDLIVGIAVTIANDPFCDIAVIAEAEEIAYRLRHLLIQALDNDLARGKRARRQCQRKNHSTHAKQAVVRCRVSV